MGIFIFWVILSFVVASIGEKRKIGFWGALLCSIILSPVIGLIITLVSSNVADEAHKKQMLNAIQNSKTTIAPQARSIAEELEKLASLRDKGVITQTEFEMQKSKLLR